MKRWILRQDDCRRIRNYMVVRSFMAHHQGMSLLTLAQSAAAIQNDRTVPPQ